MTTKTHFEMFANFISRDGYTTEQAIYEYNIINGKTQQQYLKTVRMGATFGLNRIQRIGMYCSYINAKKHSEAAQAA